MILVLNKSKATVCSKRRLGGRSGMARRLTESGTGIFPKPKLKNLKAAGAGGSD
jgi:hypothetical protein